VFHRVVDVVVGFGWGGTQPSKRNNQRKRNRVRDYTTIEKNKTLDCAYRHGLDGIWMDGIWMDGWMDGLEDDGMMDWEDGRHRTTNTTTVSF
jgi:hypothetical protein